MSEIFFADILKINNVCNDEKLLAGQQNHVQWALGEELLSSSNMNE